MLRIGSEPDNDLILAAGQAAAHHLRIRLDRRGWVLEVLPDATRVYVNARPVRERAILRPGDMLSVGDCRMLLCADGTQKAAHPPRCPNKNAAPSRCVRWPGRSPVRCCRCRIVWNWVRKGASRWIFRRARRPRLTLFWHDGQLQLETGQPLDSRYALRVNGVATQQAVLLPGDQIGIGMHRFLVDAPGLQPEPEIVLPEPAHEPLPEDVAGPRGEVWWLIVTAAVLALGIAVLLLVHF